MNSQTYKVIEILVLEFLAPYFSTICTYNVLNKITANFDPSHNMFHCAVFAILTSFVYFLMFFLCKYSKQEKVKKVKYEAIVIPVNGGFRIDNLEDLDEDGQIDDLNFDQVAEIARSIIYDKDK